MFSLNLCFNGVFKEIIVDDFIPVSKNNKPQFANSRNKEIWPIILEKAFAKKYGAYWHTGGGGNASKVLKDLTGAPVYNYTIEKYITKFNGDKEKLHRKIFTLIKNSHNKNYITVAQTHKQKDKVMTQFGIAEWHYYTILDSFHLKNGDYVLKLRNPWGRRVWTGQYSLNDETWLEEALEKDVKDVVKLEDVEANHGVFFMPIDCFVENFQEIDICECDLNNEYSQFEFNSFNILKNKTHFFQIKVKKSGDYHLCFSQKDSRNLNYDYVSLILVKKKGENFEFLKSTGNVLRDIILKVNLDSGELYFLYIHIPEILFYQQEKQHFVSLNSYGPGITGISKIDNFYEEKFREYLKKSLIAEAIKREKWYGFKKEEFKDAKYSLIHETGIGAVVFKNDSETRLRFSFSISGNNVAKCKEFLS